MARASSATSVMLTSGASRVPPADTCAPGRSKTTHPGTVSSSITCAWSATLPPGSDRSDALLRRGVGLAVKVFLEHLAEHRLVRGGPPEQGHGRAQLERVDAAEDLLRG